MQFILDTDEKVHLANSSIHLFQSSSDHSYKCSAEAYVVFNGTNLVSFKDVQVQPYDVNSNGDFSTGKFFVSCFLSRQSTVIACLKLAWKFETKSVVCFVGKIYVAFFFCCHQR